jgi:hypothetical protein
MKLKICQLNIEGISRSKSEYLARLTRDEDVIDVIAIQETHTSFDVDLYQRDEMPIGWSHYHMQYTWHCSIRQNIVSRLSHYLSGPHIHVLAVKEFLLFLNIIRINKYV